MDVNQLVQDIANYEKTKSNLDYRWRDFAIIARLIPLVLIDNYSVG